MLVWVWNVDDLRLGLYGLGLIFMCDFCEIMESSVEVRKMIYSWDLGSERKGCWLRDKMKILLITREWWKDVICIGILEKWDILKLTDNLFMVLVKGKLWDVSKWLTKWILKLCGDFMQFIVGDSRVWKLKLVCEWNASPVSGNGRIKLKCKITPC